MINMITKIMFITSIFLFSFSCDKNESLASGKREQEILKQFTVENNIKFNEYLVGKETYTTAGHLFQEKYHKHLIGIIGDIINNKNLFLKKKTVGFYFDKKAKNAQNTKKLYLGLDIDSQKTFETSYSSESMELFKNSLNVMIETVFSCKSVFLEEDVIGVVIGRKVHPAFTVHRHVRICKAYSRTWCKWKTGVLPCDAILTLHDNSLVLPVVISIAIEAGKPACAVMD